MGVFWYGVLPGRALCNAPSRHSSNALVLLWKMERRMLRIPAVAEAGAEAEAEVVVAVALADRGSMQWSRSLQ